MTPGASFGLGQGTGTPLSLRCPECKRAGRDVGPNDFEVVIRQRLDRGIGIPDRPMEQERRIHGHWRTQRRVRCRRCKHQWWTVHPDAFR